LITDRRKNKSNGIYDWDVIRPSMSLSVIRWTYNIHNTIIYWVEKKFIIGWEMQWNLNEFYFWSQTRPKRTDSFNLYVAKKLILSLYENMMSSLQEQQRNYSIYDKVLIIPQKAEGL
jgi:hypothetical protein